MSRQFPGRGSPSLGPLSALQRGSSVSYFGAPDLGRPGSIVQSSSVVGGSSSARPGSASGGVGAGSLGSGASSSAAGGGMLSPSISSGPVDVDAPDYRVFHTTTVTEDKKGHISALDSYGDHVICAGSDGSLQWFEADAEKVTFSRKLNKVISHKSIDQVYSTGQLFISLSGGSLRVHELPSLRLIDEVEKAKGAYAFVCSRGCLPSPGIPHPSAPLLMAVAIKKKPIQVFVFDPEGSRFTLRAEVACTDTVRFMHWFPAPYMPPLTHLTGAAEGGDSLSSDHHGSAHGHAGQQGQGSGGLNTSGYGVSFDDGGGDTSSDFPSSGRPSSFHSHSTAGAHGHLGSHGTSSRAGLGASGAHGSGGPSTPMGGRRSRAIGIPQPALRAAAATAAAGSAGSAANSSVPSSLAYSPAPMGTSLSFLGLDSATNGSSGAYDAYPDHPTFDPHASPVITQPPSALLTRGTSSRALGGGSVAGTPSRPRPGDGGGGAKDDEEEDADARVPLDPETGAPLVASPRAPVLCFATKKGYSLVDVNSGRITPLLLPVPSSSSHSKSGSTKEARPTALCPLPHGALLAFHDAGGYPISPTGAPVALSLWTRPEGPCPTITDAISRGRVRVYHRPSAALLSSSSSSSSPAAPFAVAPAAEHAPAVEFSSPPTCVGYAHPYVVGVLPGSIEVRSLLTNAVVQTLPFEGGSLASFKGASPATAAAVIAAMTGSSGGGFGTSFNISGSGAPSSGLLNRGSVAVRGDLACVSSSKLACSLVPLPLPAQVRALVKRSSFTQALALAEQAEPSAWSGVGERGRRVAEIAALRAYHIFLAGDYHEGVAAFRLAQVDPRQVFALYPSLVPSGYPLRVVHPVQLPQHPVPPSGPGAAAAVAALVGYLKWVRGVLLATGAGEGEEATAAAAMLYSSSSHSTGAGSRGVSGLTSSLAAAAAAAAAPTSTRKASDSAYDDVNEDDGGGNADESVSTVFGGIRLIDDYTGPSKVANPRGSVSGPAADGSYGGSGAVFDEDELTLGNGGLSVSPGSATESIITSRLKGLPAVRAASPAAGARALTPRSAAAAAAAGGAAAAGSSTTTTLPAPSAAAAANPASSAGSAARARLLAAGGRRHPVSAGGAGAGAASSAGAGAGAGTGMGAGAGAGSGATAGLGLGLGFDPVHGLGSLSLNSELLVITDTVLVAALLVSAPGAVGAFLASSHRALLPEAERLLRRHGRIKDIVALYRERGKHGEALALLKDYAHASGADAAAAAAAAASSGAGNGDDGMSGLDDGGGIQSLRGVGPTVAYLRSLLMPSPPKPLTAETLALVKEWSGWVIAEEPGAALDIFLPPSSTGDGIAKGAPETMTFIASPTSVGAAAGGRRSSARPSRSRAGSAATSAVAGDDDDDYSADPSSTSGAALSGGSGTGAGAGAGSETSAAAAAAAVYSDEQASSVYRFIQAHCGPAISTVFLEFLLKASTVAASGGATSPSTTTSTSTSTSTTAAAPGSLSGAGAGAGAGLHTEFVALTLADMRSAAEEVGLPGDLEWFDVPAYAAGESAGDAVADAIAATAGDYYDDDEGGATGSDGGVSDFDDDDDGDDLDAGDESSIAYARRVRRRLLSRAFTGTRVPPRMHTLYTRLLAFFASSPLLDPAAALTMLPSEALQHARLRLLRRLGQHTEIIKTYVVGMRRYRKAERYCEEVCTAADAAAAAAVAAGKRPPQQPQPYQTLLRILLQEAGAGGADANAANAAANAAADAAIASASSAALTAALHVLTRHAARIDLPDALARVPPTAAIAGLEPFLVRVISGALHRTRTAKITKNLRKSQNVAVHAELQEEARTRVVIDHETTCHQCKKKIGLAAFVLSAEREVLHYVCFSSRPAAGAGAFGLPAGGAQ